MRKISGYDKIIIEKLNKEKRWKFQRFFYPNYYLKDGLGVEFIVC